MDLILAGEGDQSQELAALCEALDLKHRVIMCGRAKPEEVIRLLNGCRLVVIPSREEPFGIVAMEAIASGHPVVATRVGGLPEVFAAFAASNSGASPLCVWAEPEPDDLARSILRGLSQSSTGELPLLPFDASVANMTRRYFAVLSGMARLRTTETSSHSRAAC
jgi:glycosyltransferase involved in cell wall biosynthesis